MESDKPRKGFAGLDLLSSEIDVAEAPTEVRALGDVADNTPPPISAKPAYTMWWLVGGIAVLLFLAFQPTVHGPSPSPVPSHPRYQPDYHPPPPPPRSPLQTNDYSEVKPPVGNDFVASRANIRYCLFQKERLHHARRLINGHEPAVVDLLNGEIDDWNNRCARYRYQTSDYSAAQADVTAKLANLHADAAVLVGGWAPKAAPTWPPSEPPVRDKIPIPPPAPSPTPSPVPSPPMPPAQPHRFDTKPVTVDEAFERTFGGVWAQDRNACPGSGKSSQYPPMTITADRATTRTAECAFEEKEGSNSEWRIKMACSRHLKRWTSDVRLIREGDFLKWSNDKGTTVYWRC